MQHLRPTRLYYDMEYHVKYNVHIYIYMNQCIYIHLRDNIHMCVYIYIYRCGTLEMYKDVGDSLYHLGLGYRHTPRLREQLSKGCRAHSLVVFFWRRDISFSFWIACVSFERSHF